jgi:hypothetical protein
MHRIFSQGEISNLDAQANPTGAAFSTTTSNDLGRFEVEFDAAPLVSIEGNGSYYNEVTGSLSDGALTLRALYEVADEVADSAVQDAYVNLITHLTFGRVKKLILDGATFDGARAQAEQELRAALAVVPDALSLGADGAHMNILGGDSDDNAYLLARVVPRDALDVVPGRRAPEDPIPMFTLAVSAPDIAYVEFGGPRTGEFLAAAEVRATLADSPSR